MQGEINHSRPTPEFCTRVRRLLLVIVDKPFRDGEGHDGYTGADKAEILSLTCVLGTLAIGYTCWTITSKRPLTKTEDFLAIVGRASTTVLCCCVTTCI